MARVYLVVAAIFASLADAQDANCDFSQNVQVGQTYYIYSPRYPANYTAGVQCRWVSVCPTGYNCRIDCSEINIPQSPGCSVDRLLVSTSGDQQLAGADTYCGLGTLTATSTNQRLSMGLISSRGTSGGRFMCSLRAQTSSASGCSCGYKKTNRIVGGQESGVNEFPMMAAIWDKRIDEVRCGAVIIYNHYLITAAHCLRGQVYSNFQIVVGKHNIRSQDSPPAQRFGMRDVLIHPSYNPNTFDYDIALILTDRTIEFSDRVGPACLPFKFSSSTLAGAKVTVLGWGTLFAGGPTSDTLQKVDLDVISQASCRQRVPSVTNRQMCTFTRGKDACQFDSGGPLLYTDATTGLLFHVGIISNGQFCAAGDPGINTRVTELLNWITTSTPDANYCRK